MSARAQLIECAFPIRFPDIFAHLQGLNQKFSFDNPAGSGFEIEKIRSTPALATNALEHIVDLYRKIDILTGVTPGAFCYFDKFTLQRARNSAGPGQRL